MECKVQKAGEELSDTADASMDVGCQNRQAIYNRLIFIDWSIFAYLRQNPKQMGKYLGPNLANRHCLLTAREPQAPNGDDKAT